MNNDPIQRSFFIGEARKTRPIKENEILNMLSSEENYMVIADGGMGKSFLSERWTKELEKDGFKRVNAQELTFDLLTNKLLIDNLDEISLEKANNIIEQIYSKKLKGIIIFSRPESVWAKNNIHFKTVSFINVNGENPRYSMEYEINGEDLFNGFSNFFSKQLHGESKFDFLSILSFKLLTSGVIHYNEQDLFEFIRKYNINNSSNISMEWIHECGLFKKAGSNVYFKNKTIPAYFSTLFLKKFSNIKNSYLSYFDNFASQISFVESAKILKSTATFNELSWDLIRNNGFVFMFLARYESATGLTDILIKGLEKNPAFDVTNLLIKLICKIANDEDFNGLLYLDEFEAKIFRRVNTNRLLQGISLGIADDSKKRIALHHFCNWAKHSLTYEKDFEHWKEIKSEIKKFFSKKITNLKRGDEGNKRNFADILFDLDDISSFEKETYDNYVGPVESAVNFCLALKQYKMMFHILEKFGISKGYFDEKYTKEWEEFIKLNIKNKRLKFVIKIFEKCHIPVETIVTTLKSVGNKAVIDAIRSSDHDYYSKINVTQEYYSHLIKDIEDEYMIYSKFYIIDEKSKEEEINEYDFAEMKEDIRNFKFQKYLERYSSYYPSLKPIKINNIDEDFLEKIIVEVKKSFDDSSLGPEVFKNIEPLYQIIATYRDINISDLHPMVLLQLKNLRLNSYRSLYWSDEVDPMESRREVIKYFSDINHLNRVFNTYNTHLLSGFLDDIINNQDDKGKNSILGTLYKSLNPKHWWSTFFRFKNVEISKKYLKENVEKPENIYEYINDMERCNYLVDEKIISERDIKKMFIDLLESRFSHLYRKGGGTVHWYDNFFFTYGEKEYLSKMLLILEKLNIEEWYVNKFIELFPKHVDAAPEYVIYTFVKHMATLSYLSNSINEKEELVKFRDKLNPEHRLIVNRAWLNLKGILFEGVNKSRTLNISEFYRYMNDDWTQLEFSNVFEDDIVPLISDIFNKKKISERTEKLETIVHDEINRTLPLLLMKKYSIIYQAESNPYNNEDPRKRIDFILSRNGKYIFIELKASDNPQLSAKKISDQLNTYKSNIVISDNYLLIFKNHNMGAKRRRGIELAAISKNFKIIDIC